MSEIAEIEQAMAQLLRDLQSEGHIDNQFQQLLMLQDESEPDFVRSVMELFFQVSSCVGVQFDFIAPPFSSNLYYTRKPDRMANLHAKSMSVNANVSFSRTGTKCGLQMPAWTVPFEVIAEYMLACLQDSQNTLQRIHDMIVAPQADYILLDQAVHELKGSAASFGAHRITSLCVELRRCVQERRIEQSELLVKSIADARHILNEKLSSYIQLENRKKQLSKGF